MHSAGDASQLIKCLRNMQKALFHDKHHTNQAWWCTHVIQHSGGSEINVFLYCIEFEASLSFVRPRLTYCLMLLLDSRACAGLVQSLSGLPSLAFPGLFLFLVSWELSLDQTLLVIVPSLRERKTLVPHMTIQLLILLPKHSEDFYSYWPELSQSPLHQWLTGNGVHSCLRATNNGQVLWTR